MTVKEELQLNALLGDIWQVLLGSRISDTSEDTMTRTHKHFTKLAMGRIGRKFKDQKIRIDYQQKAIIVGKYTLKLSIEEN